MSTVVIRLINQESVEPNESQQQVGYRDCAAALLLSYTLVTTYEAAGRPAAVQKLDCIHVGGKAVAISFELLPDDG